MNIVFRAALILPIIALSALCRLSGSLSLSSLLGQSDQVVVATVQSGDLSSGLPTLQLLITRQLQGKQIASNKLTVLISQSASNFSMAVLTALVGKTGIWFLIDTDRGECVVPLVSGDTHARDLFIETYAGELPEKYLYSSSADPRVKLINELEAASLYPNMSSTIARLVFSKMIDDGIGADLAQSFYAELSASSDAAIRIVGLAGQIRSGQSSALTSLVALPLKGLSANQISLLTQATCDYRGTDLSAIGKLTTLTEAGFPTHMRACAAHALREIHSRDTLIPLQSLLDSASADIRYDAVIGIAQFAMHFPMAKPEQKHKIMSTFQTDSTVTN